MKTIYHLTYDPITHCWSSSRNTVPLNRVEKAFSKGTPQYDVRNANVMKLYLCDNWLRVFYDYPEVSKIQQMRVVVTSDRENDAVWFGPVENEKDSDGLFILIGNGRSPLRVPVSVPLYAMVMYWCSKSSEMFTSIEYRTAGMSWTKAPVRSSYIPPEV